MRDGLIATTCLLIAACGGKADERPAGETGAAKTPAAKPGERAAEATTHRPALRWIPAGALGTDPSGPQVGPLLVAETEVTQAQYMAAVGTNPSHFKSCGGDCPVEKVSFYDAVAYCNRLSSLENLAPCYDDGCAEGAYAACKPKPDCRGYRLPSEAEWEYAARAGETRASHGGDFAAGQSFNEPALAEVAWYGGNSGVTYAGGFDCAQWDGKASESSTCGPQPVARKKANAWGLHDVLGNVAEWTQDAFVENRRSPDASAFESETPDSRVLRGGAWSETTEYNHLSSRRGAYAGEGGFNHGLRPVRRP